MTIISRNNQYWSDSIVTSLYTLLITQTYVLFRLFHLFKMNSTFRIFQQYVFYLIYCKYFLSIVFSFVLHFSLHPNCMMIWHNVYIIYCNNRCNDIFKAFNNIHDLRYMIDTLISVHALFISIRKKVHSTLARCIEMIHSSLTKRFNF